MSKEGHILLPENLRDEKRAEAETQNPLTKEVQPTFCLIKPYLVSQGQVASVVEYLQRNKFTVISSRNLFLTKDIVREMLRPFFAIMPERLLDSLCGMALMLELTRPNAVNALRTVVGHDNPADAKIGTIRYMWGGLDTVHNAVFIPQNEHEFQHMFGVIDLWARVLVQALNDQLAEPLKWSEQRFNEIFTPAVLQDESLVAPEPTAGPSGNEYDLPEERSAADRVADQYTQGG